MHGGGSGTDRNAAAPEAAAPPPDTFLVAPAGRRRRSSSSSSSPPSTGTPAATTTTTTTTTASSTVDASKEHRRSNTTSATAPPLPKEEKSATSAQTAAAAAPDGAAPYTIFDTRQKNLIVALASIAATFSGFASNIYFPALPAVSADLGVSASLANLTVTSYLIMQGLAPSFWGPVSDARGRRAAYLGTFAVFVGACVGLAVAPGYAALVVLRCAQSAGSASTIAIGSGVLGDVTTRAERGGYMGVFQAGLLVPVAVGPVVGGALAGALGWRSVFWCLAVAAGAFAIVLLLALPETLRAIVGNGAPGATSAAAAAGWVVRFPLSVYQRTTRVQLPPRDPPSAPLAAAAAAAAAHPAGNKKRIDVAGPLRILTSRHCAPIILFVAVYYAVWQMSITAMSSLFASEYGLSESQVGLTYIANGMGCILGTLLTGKFLDADFRRVQLAHRRRTRGEVGGGSSTAADPSDGNGGACEPFPLERARLRLLPLFAVLQCASILVFGWTVQFPSKVSMAVPIAATFVSGWTAIGTASVVTTYLVDVFPTKSAASSAALNFARCLCAAGGTSFVLPLIEAVGVGWAFTVCVGLQVLGLAGVGIQIKWGGAWRLQAEMKEETRNLKAQQS
ncbi:MFS multidrug transporter [Zopfochytrium polystomum]|nr:MFS multidrug transporter [Zopfochytrium polystomum]